MNKMIAYCGLSCTDCPAFIATQQDDDRERERVARRWSTGEKPLLPEEINCDGCLLDEGRLFVFCRGCPVRACGKEKGVATCGHCGEYPCDILEGLWKEIQAEDARATLDEIHRTL